MMKRQCQSLPECAILLYPSGDAIVAVDAPMASIKTLKISKAGDIYIHNGLKQLLLDRLPPLALPRAIEKGVLIVDSRNKKTLGMRLI